jgi:hypothetical protein
MRHSVPRSAVACSTGGSLENLPFSWVGIDISGSGLLLDVASLTF